MIRVTRHGKLRHIETDIGSISIHDDVLRSGNPSFETRILCYLADYLEKPPGAASSGIDPADEVESLRWQLERANNAISTLHSSQQLRDKVAGVLDASPNGGIEPVVTLTIGEAGEEGTQPYFLDRIRETEAFGNLKPGTYQLAVCSMQPTSHGAGEN